MSGELPRVAVLGAGKVGSALANLLTGAGYRVMVAASGAPEDFALVARVMMPDAVPAWAADAAEASDVVVLAIPLHRLPTVDPAVLDGKIVVDAMNYWQPVNGTLEEFEDGESGSSEIVQRALPGATVVKTFGHLTYHELEGDRRPPGAPGRRAVAVVGPSDAAEVVAVMVDRIGFDPVLRSRLELGRALQPGGPAFGTPMNRAELEAVLDRWEDESAPYAHRGEGPEPTEAGVAPSAPVGT
ncbi:NADPH-dependent F420 reductase [Streptomyces sp. NPDC058653]|uniref:NADPH-dependent F420 reductase n=1 Tax=Streptomyces sp. NPDC058653 TaxID=3346576 RepID=UPI003667E2FC